MVRLPVLKEEPAFGNVYKTCSTTDYCSSCVLFEKNGGRCGGCSPEHKKDMFGRFGGCYGECHSCTGYSVDVTGVCCRSPLKDTYMAIATKGAKDWNKPEFTYTARPRLTFKNKGVFYIASGGLSTIAPGMTRLIETDVVAVNLSRVWGGNGFYSRDLKDYLRLPKSTKLILMTMTMDDLLEKAWEKELYADPTELEKVGLDHWMPIAHSSYPNEAHMHQYYQFLRVMQTTERMHAWFVLANRRQVGLKLDDLFLQAIEKIPNVVFNTQMEESGPEWHMRMIHSWHKLAPPHVTFWFVGAARPAFVYNTRKICGDRDLYFVSAKMMYGATKGKLVDEHGRIRPSEMPKIDLVKQNFQNFQRMLSHYAKVPSEKEAKQKGRRRT